MKVLGIAGSPRENGNTQLLLDQSLEGAKSGGAKVNKIILNDLKFSPCQECGGCNDTGVCTVEDDMQIVYGKVREADALILASPIFFGCLSAQTKMMIDRFQCWWVAKYILKQPFVEKDRKRSGIFISVSGREKVDYFECAKMIVKILFANIEVVYSGDLFYPRIDEKGEILNHPAAMADAWNTGQNLVPASQL